MNSQFSLDKRLENDTKLICSLKICDLRLLDDSRWPWLVLIPRIANVVELHMLDQTSQSAIFAEMMSVSQALHNIFPDAKINTGALGNIVRQLHIHIIARHENDVNWPGPVWGVAGKIAYDDEAAFTIMDKIKHALGKDVLN
ncbi:HIT domain-containing protein [Bartonella sp. HY038]|uniref:HIT domain-containing protein n=1 Tax=Bartonella sp. HY038 TaxID=2759660 RepID=UPI0015F9C20B|nr:HIT family protein [Bartonella sp. HY038]